MKVYPRTDTHLLCGHWNGSPLEIGLTGLLTRIPKGDVYHYHDYHEYYLILRGKGTLFVEGREVPVEANSAVMVEPGERHRWAWIDPREGIAWVIIKERSAPNSKVVAPENL